MSQTESPESNDGQPIADADVAAEEEVAAAENIVSPPEPDSVPVAERTPRRTGRYLVSGLALVCALLAAAAAGYIWWQYRQFYVGFDQADTESAVSLQAVRADVRALEDRIAELIDSNEATQGLVADVDERVGALPGRFLDLEEQLSATQGVSADARRRWLRAEAGYFLAVANAELTLAGRWENAIAALEFADDKLLELANPVLGGVRERIAAELIALRAVRLPDVEGLSYSLSRLAQGSRTLPMRSTLPSNFETDGAVPEEDVTGLARVWLSLKRAVAGMVSIERRDDSAVQSLSADEQALVRQQLELELDLARFGLVRGRQEAFQQSIAIAKALLERRFDTAEVAVESAIALLDQMALLDVAPARPDISGSLGLLRGLADRDG
jgi:uroporphyrin-3 C-methyltransferase